MSSTTAYLKYQIHCAFDINLFTTQNCKFVDAITGQHCTAQLTGQAVYDANVITTRLAQQSPSNRHLQQTAVHGFPFIETLRELATCVHCQVHATPAILSKTIILWLDIATDSPTLFTLDEEIRARQFIVKLHLSQIARNTTPEQFARDLGPLISSAGTGQPLRQTILETLDDMFDAFFEDFVQNIVTETARRLALQRNRRHPDRTRSSSEAGLTRLREHSTSGSTSPSTDVPPPVPARSPCRSSQPTLDPDTHDDEDSSSSHLPAGNDRSGSDCMICTNPLATEPSLPCRTCRVYLHATCISKWALFSAAQNRTNTATCPHCRSPWDSRPHRRQSGVSDSTVAETGVRSTSEASEPLDADIDEQASAERHLALAEIGEQLTAAMETIVIGYEGDEDGGEGRPELEQDLPVTDWHAEHGWR